MPVIPQLSVKTLKHVFWTRYGLASLTKRSKLLNKVVKKTMFDGDDMIVIPKNESAKIKTIDTDISVDSAGDRTILPDDIVKELIRSSKNIFIMNFCLCRTSNKCKDYPRDRGCIFMGKGIHRIPEEFGHIATPEEAIKYVDECSELGMVHIIGRNKLDSIWLNTGDKKDLMTICNCCPCCCLWNMVRDISDDLGSVYKKMTGVNVAVDGDKCIACGKCESICFTKAVAITDGVCSLDEKMCRGCGRCVDVCPQKAISLTYDPSAIESEVARIRTLVDLS